MAADANTALKYLIYAFLLYILVYIPLFGTSKDSAEVDDDDVVDTHHLSDSLVVPDENLTCPPHSFSVHILSSAPLIVYIPSFLTNEEASHIVDISENEFEPSLIWNGEESRTDDTVRRSETALLARDNVVKCMEQRARDFQGWRPNVYIERTRSQRYGMSGHYVHHYDWSGGGGSGRGGRISTFMVYLEANCTGGGTNFPRLSMPADGKWCEFIECGSEDQQKGITFKPIKGNAIFWENLRADGKGYPETWHGALPVLSGTKIGLNIWSWYQPQAKAKPVKAEL